MSVDPIKRAIEVPLTPQDAFSLFTAGLASWWPPEYTWAGEALATIAIEPREGGRCFERGPNGFECDWGRVLAWEPPERLAFSWQIGPGREPVPDSERASEVEAAFAGEAAARTRVELKHRGFERHGEGGAGYREALDSEQGWSYIIGRYAAAAARGAGEAKS